MNSHTGSTPQGPSLPLENLARARDVVKFLSTQRQQKDIGFPSEFFHVLMDWHVLQEGPKPKDPGANAVKKWFESLSVDDRRSVLMIHDEETVSIIRNMAWDIRTFAELTGFNVFHPSVAGLRGLLKLLPLCCSFAVTVDGKRGLAGKKLKRKGKDFIGIGKSGVEYTLRSQPISTNRLLCFASFLSDHKLESYRLSNEFCLKHVLIENVLKPDVKVEERYILSVELLSNPDLLWTMLDKLAGGNFLSKQPESLKKIGFNSLDWFQELGYSTLGNVIANLVEVQLWRGFRNRSKGISPASMYPMHCRALDHFSRLSEEEQVKIAKKHRLLEKIVGMLKSPTPTVQLSPGCDLALPFLYSSSISKAPLASDLYFDILDALRTIRRQGQLWNHVTSLCNAIITLTPRKLLLGRDIFEAYKAPSGIPVSLTLSSFESLNRGMLASLVVPTWQESLLLELVDDSSSAQKEIRTMSTNKKKKKKKKSERKGNHQNHTDKPSLTTALPCEDNSVPLSGEVDDQQLDFSDSSDEDISVMLVPKRQEVSAPAQPMSVNISSGVLNRAGNQAESEKSTPSQKKTVRKVISKRLPAKLVEGNNNSNDTKETAPAKESSSQRRAGHLVESREGLSSSPPTEELVLNTNKESSVNDDPNPSLGKQTPTLSVNQEDGRKVSAHTPSSSNQAVDQRISFQDRSSSMLSAPISEPPSEFKANTSASEEIFRDVPSFDTSYTDAEPERELGLFPTERIQSIWGFSPEEHTVKMNSQMFGWSNPLLVDSEPSGQSLFGPLFGSFRPQRSVGTQTDAPTPSVQLAEDEVIPKMHSKSIQTMVQSDATASWELSDKDFETRMEESSPSGTINVDWHDEGPVIVDDPISTLNTEDSQSDGGEWTTIEKRYRRRPFSADGRDMRRSDEQTQRDDVQAPENLATHKTPVASADRKRVLLSKSATAKGTSLQSGPSKKKRNDSLSSNLDHRSYVDVALKASKSDSLEPTRKIHQRSESFNSLHSFESTLAGFPKSCDCSRKLDDIYEELKEFLVSERNGQERLQNLEDKMETLIKTVEKHTNMLIHSEAKKSNPEVKTGATEKVSNDSIDATTKDTPQARKKNAKHHHKQQHAHQQHSPLPPRPHTSWSPNSYPTHPHPSQVGFAMMSPAHVHSMSQQYAMYYNTNAAGVLFTDPYFCALPEQHALDIQQDQTGNLEFPSIPQVQMNRRRLPFPFSHEWHGREFLDTASYYQNEHDQQTQFYRTSSARTLGSVNELRGSMSNGEVGFGEEEGMDSLHVNAGASMQNNNHVRFLDGPTRLSHEIYQFAERCFSERQVRQAVELSVVNKLSLVVKHLWPRATVKRFGSCVTGLVLPDGDMDLVICLPKVMQDDIADEPGLLEGRNAIKMSWQQNLADALQLAPWIDTDSVKTILYAPIPIIKLMTKGPPFHERQLHLDISFQAENHNGLATNKLISSLCKQYPALSPLVLVVKQFLSQRGLGRGYTGGLSSYGLVLLTVCFLQNTIGQPNTEQMSASPVVRHPAVKSQPRSRSNSHEPFTADSVGNENDLGYLLIRFLKFYGDLRLFNPSATGVSLSKGFFDRKSSSELENSKNTLSDTESLPGTRRQVNAQTRQRHQKQRLDNSSKLQSFQAIHGQGSSSVQDENRESQLEPTVDSHRFDPIFIDDPLNPGNNVGRNCFRIAAIQRAWFDASDALRRGMVEGHQGLSLLDRIIQPARNTVG